LERLALDSCTEEGKGKGGKWKGKEAEGKVTQWKSKKDRNKV
jgi:hypothetical protein